jgi:AbrB family looped-hinge helix DNA binding protein
MRVTTKGQVTIPLHIRNFLGIGPHSEVEFTISEGKVLLYPVDGRSEEESASRFARFRGILRGKLSTEEWMEATRGSDRDS